MRGSCPTHGSIMVDGRPDHPVCPKCGLDLIAEFEYEPQKLFGVVMYGPLFNRCWVAPKGHPIDMAKNLAKVKCWTLDGVGALFKGRVEPKDMVRWYRQHSTIYNHPGYYTVVVKPETRPEFNERASMLSARLKCPHCGGMPIMELKGIEGRDAICPNCKNIWLRP